MFHTIWAAMKDNGMHPNALRWFNLAMVAEKNSTLFTAMLNELQACFQESTGDVPGLYVSDRLQIYDIGIKPERIILICKRERLAITGGILHEGLTTEQHIRFTG
jgi:hypothetical protein